MSDTQQPLTTEAIDDDEVEKLIRDISASIDINQVDVRTKVRTEKGQAAEQRSRKNKQTSALSAVTKKRNELIKFMSHENNLHVVKTCLDELNDRFVQYQQCYISHFDLLLSETEQESESRRFTDKESSFLDFRNHVMAWIAQTERHLTDQIDQASAASSRRSRHSSHTSTGMSTVSARVRAKAKLAELMVEKSTLAKRKAMKAQQYELEAQKQEFNLDVEIAKTQARQRVLADLEDNPMAEHVDHDRDGNKMQPPATASQAQTKPKIHLDKVSYTAPTHEQHIKATNQYVPDLSHSTTLGQPITALDPSVPAFTPIPHIPPDNSRSQPVNDFITQPVLPNNQQPIDFILATYQQLAAAVTLPQPEVPRFKGDTINYNTFMMSFDARIVSRTTNDVDRLYYLDQHLEGEPKELIGGCLYMEPSEGYLTARDLLDKEYGDPYKVSMAYVNKLLNWPIVKYEDSSGLKHLSFFLVKCLHAMSSMSHMLVLNHAPNMQAVILKLPAYLQNKWREKVARFRREDRAALFADLVNFIQQASEAANDPIYSKTALGDSENRQRSSSGASTRYKPTIGLKFLKPKNTSFASDVIISSTPNVSKHSNIFSKLCAACPKQHDLEDCDVFGKMNLEEKRDLLKEKRMCFGCNGYNHLSKGCMKKRICKKCGKRHPTALHDNSFNALKIPTHTPESQATSNIASPNVQRSTCNSVDGGSVILQSILPVKVQQAGSNHVISTYALYDNGSDGCFLSDELMADLQVAGTDVMLKLRTMHGQSSIKTTAIQGLVVMDWKGQNPIQLPTTYSRAEIPVSSHHIPRPEILMKWPHLQDVARQIPKYMTDLHIGLLLGSNCPLALEPLRIIPSRADGPFAALLRHGWTVNGPQQISLDSNVITCNRIVVQELESATEIISPEAVLRMFELDFNDRPGMTPDERSHSQEDKRFLAKANEGINLKDGHYEIPLPFRNSDVVMPNNREQAVKRAAWQKRKMLRDQSYHQDYVAFVNNVIDKGYAQLVNYEELEAPVGKVWYLPHHGVYHPRKPNKIRVVFDCSARYEGTSLNDQLLPGPDLTNSLVGVLTRFREESVAITGDVEAMFHQVRVPTNQCNFLRFLWWPNGDLNAVLQEYQMTVHLFGAVSSPSICNFALRNIPDDNDLELPITKIMKRNFYVDDCLKSVDQEENAIQLVHELRQACSMGGFHITKFTSNSQKVLESIPEVDRAKGIQAIDLDCDSLPIEHTLGVQWSISSDTFGFSIVVKNKPATRRGILSIVSSIFDPLGFVAPFILPAKKILQDLCKEQHLGWDDEVPEEYLIRWHKWLNDLPQLERISISRCLKPVDFGVVTSCQLHVFSDASTVGYASAAYLRLCNDYKKIHCSFVMGKARLAPIKPTTIPRLELTAATVSIHLGQMLMNELDNKPDSITYHTDSTTVLHYINSEKKRFPVFVANRVSKIRDFSQPSQWKYVETGDNPTDDGSRGLDSHHMLNKTRWINGPQFLQQPEIDWPEQPILMQDSRSNDPDEKLSLSTTASSTCDVKPMDMLINYYSDWHRLNKAIAYYIRLRRILVNRLHQRQLGSQSTSTTVVGATPLTVNELDEAEHCILKYVQSQAFQSEREVLKQRNSNISGQRGRALKRTGVPRKTVSLELVDA
jgi:hypothetical protein